MGIRPGSSERLMDLLISDRPSLVVGEDEVVGC